MFTLDSLTRLGYVQTVSEKIACPKCGFEATVVSKRNPIRNAVQSTIVCRNCGFTAVREHPPDVTLSEWLTKK